MTDTVPAGHTDISEAQYARLGRFVAAYLGTETSWCGGDGVADFAAEAHRALGRPVGDQSNDDLRFWRELADVVGVEYDAEVESDYADA